jgi:RAB protein geranylgeranyltransferase component A
MEFDLLIVGVGVEEALHAAKNAASGKRVINIGRVGEAYGGQHATIKGVDKLPLVLMPKGELASDLISLKAADYISFSPLESIVVLTSSSAPIRVPLKKEHIMLNQSISLRDKRRLMSILSSDPLGAPNNFDGLSAHAWLSSLQLDEPVIEMIMYGACFLPGRAEFQSLRASELKRKLEIFSSSLPNPLLYPLYGASEIAQALIRVAAVRGAIQILEQPASNILVHEGKDITVNFHDRFESSPNCFSCSHAFAFTPHSLFGEDGLHIYVFVPSKDYPTTLFGLQLNQSTLCCKSGYLLHFWSFCESIQERLRDLFGSHGFYNSLQYDSLHTCNKSFVY